MVKMIYNKVTDKWDVFLDGRLLISASSFQRALVMVLHVSNLKERGFFD